MPAIMFTTMLNLLATHTHTDIHACICGVQAIIILKMAKSQQFIAKKLN